MTSVGIDSIAFYVPQLYVPIKDLAEARGIMPEKLQKGLGLKKMAIPNVGEDAATFAANALLNLIDLNDINPNDIGRVYLGTESAVDGSKPTATYAVEIVEKQLQETYGTRSFKHCDILDMTFACVGAVDALHNSLDWVKQDRSRKAVVIASDLSKYDLNSTGEYTQGAGAVAVLVSHEPSIIEINDIWGVASKSEGDFFKPRRSFSKTELLQSVFETLNLEVTEEKINEFVAKTNSQFWSDTSAVVEVFKEEPVFDGQFSNACYEDRITEALSHFDQQKPTVFNDTWDKIVFHLPYAYHGRRIIFNNWLDWIKGTPNLEILESEIGKQETIEDKEWLKKAYKSQLYSGFVKNKISSGELASSEIGNMYTASLFMSLLSVLADAFRRNEDLSNSTVGFIAYGSGSKSKVFEGRITGGWTSKIESIHLFEYLAQRHSIAIDTYERLHRSEQNEPILNGSKIYLKHIEHNETNYGLRRYAVR
jgi:hydroxymethylglutaryl-CoA synthase